MLGLGVAGLFKMSCDSRSCLVFKGPTFDDEDKKKVKYNEKCYQVREKMNDSELKERLFYLVVNNFEHKIVDYTDDLESFANKFFKYVPLYSSKPSGKSNDKKSAIINVDFFLYLIGIND